MFKNFFNIVLLILVLSKYVNSSPLVGTEWIVKNSCKNDIKIIEVGSSSKAFLTQHIPCAVYTDFYKDNWRVSKDKVAMVLPTIESLSSLIGSLGIKKNDYVVLYGRGLSKYNTAEITATYFTFKYLGHKNISILNGGIKKYLKNWSNDTDTGENIPTVENYVANPDYSILANTSYVSNHTKKNLQIVDSRERDYYIGINKLSDLEYYGTIPKSINLPAEWLMLNRSLNFNDKNTLSNIFDFVGIKRDKNPIFYCYSGLESSLNWFVAHEILGYKEAKLYEGSIFDWTKNNERLLYNSFKDKNKN